MEALILAHDLGTTGVKAALFDRRGQVRGAALEEYPVHYPQPGWVEQDPEEWWRAVCTATRRLLAENGIAAGQVAGISFSGQMMGCVALNREAQPLGPALIWADTRAQAQAAQLLERVGEERAYRLTGHRASASYSAAKMMWLRDQRPEVYQAAFKFCQPKDFLAARMTGVFATDYSDASGTNLLDLERLEWSQEMLEAAGIPAEKLPELHESSDCIGRLLAGPAGELGLRAGTPVVIGGGDGCCAATGAGVVREGSAYNYIGSSSWIAIASPRPIFDPQMRTFTWAHLMKGMYSPCGTMQAAGGSYQWLRDVFCLPEVEQAAREGGSAYELMNRLAEGSPPGARNLFFFPYLLGERSPRWNADARGAFFGLNAAHTRADIVRAVLEGITLNLRVILDAFREQGAPVEAMRVIGGGARGAIWRKILADIYGVPVQRPRLLAEATSLGAALAGGIGLGFYPGWEMAEALTPAVDEVRPDPALRELYERKLAFFNRAWEGFEPLYGALRALEG